MTSATHPLGPSQDQASAALSVRCAALAVVPPTPEANVGRSARRYFIRANTGSTFVHKKYHPKLRNTTRLSSVKALGRSKYELISLSTSLFRQFIAIQPLFSAGAVLT
jgi:hypothetical protein